MRVFSLLLILLCSINLSAQKIKEKDRAKFNQLSNEQDSAIFKLASKLGDNNILMYLAFKDAALHQKEIQPLKKIAQIYYNSGDYNLCINTCNEILKIDSVSKFGLEMTAISYKNLKNFTASNVAYKYLFQYYKDASYLYQVATNYFEEGDDKACLKQLSVILNDTTIKDTLITITYNDPSNNFKEQKTPIHAAAYNVAGFVMLREKNYKLALDYFGNAVKLFPEFILAKNNLQTLKENLKEAQKSENTAQSKK